MSSDLLLHKAVFAGDLKTVESLLKKCEEKELNIQDIHGNTALHIAVMKGNKNCVELLVKKGATPTIRNSQNWMSLHEAISFGDYDIIKILNDDISQRVLKYTKRDFICKCVNEIKEDFVLKFEIRIKDHKPTTFVGHQEFKVGLTKKASKIRADIFIMDSFHTRPQSFGLIFDVNPNSAKFITITIGGLPYFQTISFDFWEQTLSEIFSRDSTEEEIRGLMSKENISIEMEWSSKKADCPTFRQCATRRVGGHRTDIYESQAIDVKMRTRSEHLRAREESPSDQRSHSLPQPNAKNVSWEEYISAPKGQFPCLGREVIETITTSRASAVIGLTEEISLDWKGMIEMWRQFFNNKVVDFISKVSKELPNGFPVVIDLPIKPSIYLKWKLHSFEMSSNIDDSIFTVPDFFQETTIFTLERNTH